MNCVIIDDEPIACNIIARYINKTPGLKLHATFDNALDALNVLKSDSVDLLFLDINMPELTGIELLESLNNPPKVIITTAYSEYGAESYEYNVCDYLMKPISFERFLKAVSKTGINFTDSVESEPKASTEYMFIKTDDTVQKIMKEEVIMAQSYGNYVKLFTTTEEFISRSTLSTLGQQLEGFLVQAHRSFLVAPKYIKQIKGNEIVLENNVVIKIGKNYRPQLFNEL